MAYKKCVLENLNILAGIRLIVSITKIVNESKMNALKSEFANFSFSKGMLILAELNLILDKSNL